MKVIKLNNTSFNKERFKKFEQKQDLEDKIKYLKKEKTALVKEVNKLTKSI